MTSALWYFWYFTLFSVLFHYIFLLLLLISTFTFFSSPLFASSDSTPHIQFHLFFVTSISPLHQNIPSIIIFLLPHSPFSDFLRPSNEKLLIGNIDANELFRNFHLLRKPNMIILWRRQLPHFTGRSNIKETKIAKGIVGRGIVWQFAFVFRCICFFCLTLEAAQGEPLDYFLLFSLSVSHFFQ